MKKNMLQDFNRIPLVRWLGCIFFILLDVYYVMSLISFTSSTQSVFYDDSALTQTTTFFSWLSINIAAVSTYFFGVAAVWFAGFFIVAALVCLGQGSWRSYSDRFVGVALAALSCSGMASLMNTDVYTGMPGGIIGASFKKSISVILDNSSLVQLVLVAFFCIALILLFRFAWVSPLYRVLEFLGSTVHAWCLATLMQKMYKIRTQLYARVRSLLPSASLAEESDADHYERSLFSCEDEDALLDPLWAQLNANDFGFSDTAPQHSASSENNVDQLNVKLTNIESMPERPKKVVPYQKPPINLVHTAVQKAPKEQDQRARAKVLEEKLGHFGIHGSVVAMTTGPTVTLFEYKPRIDTKISAILAREDDLALALEAHGLRIIAPIPGSAVVGFEVANSQQQAVYFSECYTAGQGAGLRIPLVLGKDVVGKPMVIDLTVLPHLLIAGSTGSGKSVALHTLLMSILYACSPDDLKLILIDPKRIEFSPFADLGHLMFPIQTGPKDAVRVLASVVKIMEDRYEEMARQGMRNIHDYHELRGKASMPFIVVVIDELADLMMTAGKDCEETITRLAQMARAAGIHLIVATQRPSVDVITGLIKVNFPARIAFKVASKIDSRTILDTQGAEKLLGRGDMLFMDPQSVVRRLQGAYLTSEQTNAVVKFIREQRKPTYEVLPEVIVEAHGGEAEDPSLMHEVTSFLATVEAVSISLIQRRFRIGYNRSARICESLEAMGLIAPAESGSKLRRVLKHKEKNHNPQSL